MIAWFRKLGQWSPPPPHNGDAAPMDLENLLYALSAAGEPVRVRHDGVLCQGVIALVGPGQFAMAYPGRADGTPLDPDKIVAIGGAHDGTLMYHKEQT